jgi:hypothetical protein
MIDAARKTGDISCQKIEFQRVCGHRGRGCAVAFVVRYALSCPAEPGDLSQSQRLFGEASDGPSLHEGILHAHSAVGAGLLQRYYIGSFLIGAVRLGHGGCEKDGQANNNCDHCYFFHTSHKSGLSKKAVYK